MRISELVSQLRAAEAQHGDLVVCVFPRGKRKGVAPVDLISEWAPMPDGSAVDMLVLEATKEYATNHR